MHYRHSALAALILTLTLSACGGGDSEDDDFTGAPDPVEESTGTLLDSPVSNIEYTTGTGSRSGTTNGDGEFIYVRGDRLFFSIGDLDFPSVPAADIITPLDMADTSNPRVDQVVNIIRLLQTLDQDGNPDNGIRISETASAVATQVDFDLPPEEFAESSAVTNLIYNAGQDPVVSGLVPTEQAISHFEAQLEANNIPYGTIAQQDEEAIRDYLAENSIDATEHESGLFYHIDNPGNGEAPEEDSTVEVRYRGYLLNGNVFDQTQGSDTATFELGGLIEAWRIAVPLLKPGGEGTFFIPSALAYGKAGSGGIPPNTVLIFDIELIRVVPE